jgi:hypothetical protein
VLKPQAKHRGHEEKPQRSQEEGRDNHEGESILVLFSAFLRVFSWLALPSSQNKRENPNHEGTRKNTKEEKTLKRKKKKKKTKKKNKKEKEQEVAQGKAPLSPAVLTLNVGRWKG